MSDMLLGRDKNDSFLNLKKKEVPSLQKHSGRLLTPLCYMYLHSFDYGHEEIHFQQTFCHFPDFCFVLARRVVAYFTCFRSREILFANFGKK